MGACVDMGLDKDRFGCMCRYRFRSEFTYKGIESLPQTLSLKYLRSNDKDIGFCSKYSIPLSFGQHRFYSWFSLVSGVNIDLDRFKCRS